MLWLHPTSKWSSLQLHPHEPPHGLAGSFPLAAWGCSLFSTLGRVLVVGESKPGQQGQAATYPAAGTEPQGPAVGQVLARQRVAGRGAGSAWLSMACHIADAGLKPARTLLSVPADLLAVASNQGVCKLQTGQQSWQPGVEWSSQEGLLCLAGWCGDLSTPIRWTGAADQSWPEFCWASTGLGEA